MSFYRHTPYRPTGGIALPPLTPMVRIIMIVSGVVWALQFVLWMFKVSQPPFDPLTDAFGLFPAKVIGGWLWQPFTYMWLHAADQPFHILLNMLFLWMLGGDLERHWGGRAFLRYYLVCGIGAGVFITVGGFLPSADPWVPTVGASGAIYGIILAFGKVFADRVILFMLIFPMRARTFAWVMFAVTFVFTLQSSSSAVSHVAHLGGMVVGYLYLKRAWRLKPFIDELRWKMRRRKFKVMPPKDDDWIH
jgi:membrane associated rhomboid family serine protease